MVCLFSPFMYYLHEYGTKQPLLCSTDKDYMLHILTREKLVKNPIKLVVYKYSYLPEENSFLPKGDNYIEIYY